MSTVIIAKCFAPPNSREMIAPRFGELAALTRQRIQAWQADERIRVVPTIQQIITDQLGFSLAGQVSGENFEALRDTLRYLIMTKIYEECAQLAAETAAV